jgi:hypothetical protein
MNLPIEILYVYNIINTRQIEIAVVMEKTDFEKYNEIYIEVIRKIEIFDTMIHVPKTKLELNVWYDLMSKKQTDVRLNELRLANEFQECLGGLYEMIGSNTKFGKMNNHQIEKIVSKIERLEPHELEAARNRVSIEAELLSNLSNTCKAIFVSLQEIQP